MVTVVESLASLVRQIGTLTRPAPLQAVSGVAGNMELACAQLGAHGTQACARPGRASGADTAKWGEHDATHTRCARHAAVATDESWGVQPGLRSGGPL
eukprot:3754940-Alexandrium_andersonii.AAC.1